jgi:hypothetical protein
MESGEGFYLATRPWLLYVPNSSLLSWNNYLLHWCYVQQHRWMNLISIKVYRYTYKMWYCYMKFHIVTFWREISTWPISICGWTTLKAVPSHHSGTLLFHPLTNIHTNIHHIRRGWKDMIQRDARRGCLWWCDGTLRRSVGKNSGWVIYYYADMSDPDDERDTHMWCNLFIKYTY